MIRLLLALLLLSSGCTSKKPKEKPPEAKPEPSPDRVASEARSERSERSQQVGSARSPGFEGIRPKTAHDLRRELQTSEHGARVVVAVLYFDNNTKDPDYDLLCKGIADMVVTELTQVKSIDVVERERLDTLITELHLQQSDYFDPTTAQKIGKGIGASFVLTGAIAAVDPKVRIDVRLIEIATAKVVMADKVVGQKKKFFALHDALMKKFLAGLNLEFAAPPERKNRIDDLDLLLEYSRGVDAAERGDLETAEKALEGVAKRDPSFVLAKDRHASLVERLAAAKIRREQVLSASSESLLKNANKVLKKNVLATKGKVRARFLGYRVIRGKYILHRLKKEVAYTSDHSLFGKRIPEEKQEVAALLMQEYYDNTYALITDLKRIRGQRKKNPRYRFAISDADADRARSLGLGRTNIESWFPATPKNIATALAEFVLTGHASSVHGPEVRVHPALAQLDGRYRRRAVALLDDAVEEVLRYEPRRYRTERHVRVLDRYAKILLEAKDTKGAAAKWQAILDRYPEHHQFSYFEEQMKKALGLTAESKKQATAQADLDLALQSCQGMNVMVQFGQASTGLSMPDYRALYQRVEQTCGAKLHKMVRAALYRHAVMRADMAKDCDWVAELVAKQEAEDATLAANLAAVRTNCK